MRVKYRAGLRVRRRTSLSKEMTAPPSLAQILLAFVEHSIDGIVVVDASKNILAASPAAAALLGAEHPALVGRNIGDFMSSRVAEHEARWARIERGEHVRAESIVTRPDGSQISIELVTTANVLPGVHVGVFRDITARRERELLSERYELLARHTNDIVLFIDADGRIVEANEAAERAYRLTRGELVGLPVRELRASRTLGDYDAQLERAFTVGVLFETEHLRKDGTTFPVEVSSRSALVGGRRMLLSIIRDITDRRLIQAQLVQADRLGAFGMIAAGVAHEINNPLAYSLNNLEMLARRVPQLVARLGARGSENQAAAEIEQIEQMLATAREGLERVRHITRDLKTFSRPDDEEVGWVDVHQILESAVNITRGDIRHRAVLVRDYGEIWPVRANTSRLGQVFLNLLLNAAQAIAPDRMRPAEIRLVTRMEGDTVVVEVNDDGVGIPAALVDRVFEPFVTTKTEGTGLGLYIARSTVRGYGGDIRIAPRSESGTSVHVLLPASGETKPPRQVLEEPVRTPDLPWRILVVDDEVILGGTLRDLLGEVRNVVVTRSGGEALEKIAAAEAPFDAVLCDVMMPGMSGKDLYDQVRTRWPALAAHFIFMTGGATTASLQDFLRTTAIPCLTKPFTRDELEQALRRAVAPS